MPDLKVYTDGACSLRQASSSGMVGVGGWAWCASHTLFDYGSAMETTNNRMELIAVIEAMTYFEGTGVGLTIVSDSKYVVDAFLQRWVHKWEAMRWIKDTGKPVPNADLWKLALPLSRGVEFQWVKGHSGNTMNALADRLAVGAKEAALSR